MTFSDEHKKKAERYFRRLGRSLVGRPEPELPDVKTVPIKTLVETLTEIPVENWWKYAFSREPLNGCFNDSQRQDMYLKAMQCARQAIDQYGGLKPSELAEKMGLSVQHPDIPQSSARILFADFREPDTIRVYQDGIKKGKALQRRDHLKNLSFAGDDLAEILIGHELFHVFELRNPRIWTKTFRITLWKVGFLKNDSPVHVLSEIAAMAFAASLTGITYSPFVLDAFLVYGYSPKAGSALYEEMIDAAKAARACDEKAVLCAA